MLQLHIVCSHPVSLNNAQVGVRSVGSRHLKFSKSGKAKIHNQHYQVGAGCRLLTKRTSTRSQ
jgi:hypothetical protein